MAAGWRDYLGFLPFVRSRTPPAPVQPSVNLLTYTVTDLLSLDYEAREMLTLTSTVSSSDGAARKRSPLQRVL
jgi:hypothetical protein